MLYEVITGFLQLFFPDEEAELTVLVDPAFRQKGIFKNLLAMAAAELELFYVSVLRCYPPFAGDEQNRRAGTIQALQKTGWTLESTELVMRFDMYNKLSSVKEDTSLVLTLSQRKHIQAIVITSYSIHYTKLYEESETYIFPLLMDSLTSFAPWE